VTKDEPRVIGMPQLIGYLIKLALFALVIATPIIGVWVASSLAAHANASTALTVAGGAILFPVGPLLWEAWAAQRSRGPRQSHFIDRLILRTLFLNVLFLGVLLGTRPKAGFVALSTRGDWFLDGRSGPGVERARSLAFAAAAQLEWLYLAVHKNPYREPTKKKQDDKPTPVPDKKPEHTSSAAGVPSWPIAGTIHPLVGSIPAAAEGSIGDVAYYIAAHERDPYLRVKALHDYVVDRIAYDVPALSLPRVPQEDAEPEDVFRNKKGVCAGYAQLLAALAKVTGDEIVYVVGNARLGNKDDEGGNGHAWNAVRLGGKWYLIDATWDAGFVNDGKFTKHYRTEYFLTPPEYFGLDHFPDEEKWQLRDQPISRGDFMRQPMMSPAFYAEGFQLVAPDRSQVTVDSAFDAQVKNRNGRFMMADFVPKLGGASVNCEVNGDTMFSIHCVPPSAGEYEVRLFSAGERYATYASVGRIDVNRR
jgi:transglutaminase-like putative cysteine protease